MASLELRYAVQQQRIREIVKEIFRDENVSFDTRFRPVGIAFTINDEKGHRIGFLGGVTTVSEFERMTDQTIVEKIRQGIRFG